MDDGGWGAMGGLPLHPSGTTAAGVREGLAGCAMQEGVLFLQGAMEGLAGEPLHLSWDREAVVAMMMVVGVGVLNEGGASHEKC